MTWLMNLISIPNQSEPGGSNQKKQKGETQLDKNRTSHTGTKQLAISGHINEDWYFCWNPSNTEIGAEGPWQDWVSLAREILKEHEKLNRAALSQLVIANHKE